MVSPTVAYSCGGSYHTSAGVFNSGLYAPNGISITYSSAKTVEVEAKIPKIIEKIRNFTF